jgi:hypothetical protein
MNTQVKIDGHWRKLGEDVKHGNFWWTIAAIHYDCKIELIRTAKDSEAINGFREYHKIIYEDGYVNHTQVTVKGEIEE